MKKLINFLMLMLAMPALAQTNDLVVKDRAFFEGITYEWTDDAGNTRESNLAEVATTPKQIIAMIRKVYTDKRIPGNYKRGFDANGNFPDGSGLTSAAKAAYSHVSYPAIGSIKRNGSNYSYEDGFGWGITTEKDLIVKTIRDKNNNGTYAYFDQSEYKPEEEGVTLLLVEMVDDYDRSKYSYTSLENSIKTMIKSVRIVTEGRRMGQGQNRGTLFKIDCDKMNKFYLMAKGQLRMQFSSMYIYGNGRVTANFCPYPLYFYGVKVGQADPDQGSHFDLFSHYNCEEPFYQMFEQFSPVNLHGNGGPDDLYQQMINMQSFKVEHDCYSVAKAGEFIDGKKTPYGHEFMMYGWDSGYEDCQDVRDLMFFVPDYRMMYWSGRNEAGDKRMFLNYNQEHQPSMGLYVIRQDEITLTDAADDHYMLQLNWRTNLDDFLPSEDQEFELWQIVEDEETGEETYVPVYYRNANGDYTDAAGNVVGEANKVPIKLQMEAGEVKKYPDVYVELKGHSQQVTYVVRGQDAADEEGKHFLSLQTSNRQSYIIPGLDPNEMVLLQEATHYSRFNPQNITNCYSNKLIMKSHNNGMNESNIDGNTRMYVIRHPQGGEAITVATIAFDKDNRKYTIQMAEQASKTDFPEALDGSGYAGYHANNKTATAVEGNGSWTKSYTVDENGYIDLGDDLIIYDNFVADVANNEHPTSYVYVVETNYPGVPVAGVENPTAHSNKFRVPVYKTDSQMNDSFTKSEVDGDNGNIPSLDVNNIVKFDVQVEGISKTEILRYDAYRWSGTTETAEHGRHIVTHVGGEDVEQDVAPHGLASNQENSYTVSMNGVNTSTVAISLGEKKFITFEDPIPYNAENADIYDYAPVVETFTSGKNVNGKVRTDYNTYGGPIKTATVGRFQAQVVETERSPYAWPVEAPEYTYYNVFLDFSKAEVPSSDYELYKVRVWRQAPTAMLGEELPAYQYRLGTPIDGSNNSSFLYDEITHGTDSECHMGTSSSDLGVIDYKFGSKPLDENIYKATFGARIIGTQAGQVSEIPLTFIVRAYYTKKNNLPTASGVPAHGLKAEGDADGKYYVVEHKFNYTMDNTNVNTAIFGVTASKDVVSVRYYDMMGKVISTPRNGVYIMETRYSDGTISTRKVLK